MIAVLKPGANAAQIASLTQWLRNLGVQVHSYEGNNSTVLGRIHRLLAFIGYHLYIYRIVNNL